MRRLEIRERVELGCSFALSNGGLSALQCISPALSHVPSDSTLKILVGVITIEAVIVAGTELDFESVSIGNSAPAGAVPGSRSVAYKNSPLENDFAKLFKLQASNATLPYYVQDKQESFTNLERKHT